MKKNWIGKYFEKYKTFIVVSNFTARANVFTIHLDNIQHMVSEHHNFKNYKRTLKSGLVYKIGHKLLGEGIFFTDGIVWEVQRLHSNPMFKRENIIEMMPIFIRKSNEVISHLKTLDLTKPVDIQDIFMRYTLESFGEIGFGLSFDLISKNSSFPKLFDTAQYLMIQQIRSVFNRLFKSNQYQKAIDDIDKVVYDIIDQKRKTDYQNKEDILSKFMSLRDVENKPYSDKWIRDIIINFMIAGRDTTATLLTWTTYILATHPDIKRTLKKEISQLGKTPTFETISDNIYLDNIIKESLRLYAPVPGVSRNAEKDDILPDGTKILAGTRVRYYTFYVHRSPQYWDEPLEFRPDRWNNQADIIKHSYQYLPFHGGPMSCIGRKMAVLEAKCMLVLLLQNFDIETVPNHKYDTFIGIITNCEGGCPILLKPINLN